MSGPHPQSGFTLLELMITIAILAVIAAFAVPSFQSLIMLNRLASEANELVAALSQTRTEAIRVNRRVILCRAATDGATVAAATGCVAGAGRWAGWMVFVDADGSGTYNPNAASNPDEVLIRTHAFHGNLLQTVAGNALAGAGNRIVFRPDGLARAPGQTLLQTATLRLCHASATMQQNARDVRLGGGSRVSVARATSAACAAPEDV
ncbi:GspH/FimT family pseudopilin [Methyloversatilis discipulorum]|uniref:GspH/FimT family pseudopilin n=1 Tax=Methyloversatilis discipulorum TaxID=1119528 RepID=UPI003AF4CFD6